jgi:hypothetical protein
MFLGQAIYVLGPLQLTEYIPFRAVSPTWEQMNSCSCLNLTLACIVYWQAREISRVLTQCDPVADRIDLSLLEHLSPIEWDNVVLYGQYVLDRKLVRPRRHSKKGLS